MHMKRLNPILSHSPAIIENDYRAYIPWPVTVPDSPLNFHLGSDGGDVLACRKSSQFKQLSHPLICPA